MIRYVKTFEQFQGEEEEVDIPDETIDDDMPDAEHIPDEDADEYDLEVDSTESYQKRNLIGQSSQGGRQNLSYMPMTNIR